MIWGTTITPGNEYALVFKDELHLSLATLESRDEYGSASGSPCHLILTTKRTNYLLCTLLNRVVYQQVLDLTLMPNEKVTFKCQGETKIHLTGYTRRESISNDRNGSLDDRVQRSANAALELAVAEGNCETIVLKESLPMKEHAEDCSNREGMLDGYQGNELIVAQSNDQKNDVSSAIEQGDVEEGTIQSNSYRGAEATNSDVQEDNILVKALRDCVIGKEEFMNSFHSEKNYSSINVDPSKGSSESVSGITLDTTSYRDALNRSGSDDWTLLTEKAIKTEREDTVDGETCLQMDSGVESSSTRYVKNGGISVDTYCESKMKTVKEHNGLTDDNYGSMTAENETHDGGIVNKEINCKNGTDNMGSVKNTIIDKENTIRNVMQSLSDVERQGACNSPTTSVTDGNGRDNNNITPLEHHEGQSERRKEDSLFCFPVGESKNGTSCSQKISKTDLEIQLKKLKRELREMQSSYGTNLVIDECLDIVGSIPLSDADDSMKTKERMMTSSDELPDLELDDILPDIDDIVIKEEIDFDNSKELEDIEIMLLNTFHGKTNSDAQDLILKKEDLSFGGLLDDCGQCLNKGVNTDGNCPKKTDASHLIMKEEASDTKNPVKRMEWAQRTELASLSNSLREYLIGPIDFKLDVPDLHPETQREAQSGNTHGTNATNRCMDAPTSQQASESSLLGASAQNMSIHDVFTSNVRNLKVTLSKHEVRKAMSNQVVKKEEDDDDVPEEDEARASLSEGSDSVPSEDETDWEAIVESRSERDTKKRKSKTKAKEVTAKLLKEIGDVAESDDENQREGLKDSKAVDQTDGTDTAEKDSKCEEGNIQETLEITSKGKRGLKSKCKKKKNKCRTEKLLTSDESNMDPEKRNKRKHLSDHTEEMQTPQKKKFCLPVKLSLMKSVKTPRHRSRVNHKRLKCRYCSKSYLYIGSLRRHESTHKESHRSSIHGRASGNIHSKLNQPRQLSNIQSGINPAHHQISRKELNTTNKCNVHANKPKRSHCGFSSINVASTNESLKDNHLQVNDKLSKSLSDMPPKSPDNLTTKQNPLAPPRPFKCKFCPKKFIHEGSLRSHEVSHDDKTLQCSQCDEVFSRSDQLIQHDVLKHGTKMTSVCPICQKCFTCSSDCDIHVQKSHVNPKKPKDGSCKSTPKKSETKQSEKLTISKDFLPYRCKSCEKSFRLQSVLKQHESVHKGKKPFNCRICKKGFRILDNCRRHEGKHMKDNSVKNQPGDLAGDLAVKQGGDRISQKTTPKAIVKPFKCQHCSKSFPLKELRHSHEKQHSEKKLNYSHVSSKKVDKSSNHNINQLSNRISSS